MKGIIFTEFFELVVKTFTEDILDDVIDRSHLPNDGAYTSVGSYSHRELLTMISALSDLTATPVEELIAAFAEHLAGMFQSKFPQFFTDTDLFTLLQSVDSVIHVEVRKLYPDARPPEFTTRLTGDRELEMTYRSDRPLADLAEGLIRSVAKSFNTDITIVRRDLESGPHYVSRFVVIIQESPIQQTSLSEVDAGALV